MHLYRSITCHLITTSPLFTANPQNAIAPEVLDSVEVMKKVRQNYTKWTFHSPYRFNWYMVFCSVSGTYSGTKSSNEIEKFEAPEKQVPKIS